MRKIRVLVVDDAVVIRRVVSNILEDDPAIGMVETAINGAVALTKIEQMSPDVVVLDVEMPVLDGLGTITAIRKIYPLLPVIMFSQQTERGADATLNALFLGANDYVTKPNSGAGLDGTKQILRENLVPKIKALCTFVPTIKVHLDKPKTLESIQSKKVLGKQKIDILAIGTSTGGPNALAAVLTELPANFPVPIVIVQHMPPLFTQLLCKRLEAITPFSVREAINGQALEPNHIWLAPGDHHAFLKRKSNRVELFTSQGPAENSCRPSVDVLFRSVAEAYGQNTLAVILTGMGQDGLRGCEQIHEQGGQIIAQDEESSVAWGMPGSVIRAGIATKVVPLNHIAGEITRCVRFGRNVLSHQGDV